MLGTPDAHRDRPFAPSSCPRDRPRALPSLTRPRGFAVLQTTDRYLGSNRPYRTTQASSGYEPVAWSSGALQGPTGLRQIQYVVKRSRLTRDGCDESGSCSLTVASPHDSAFQTAAMT